MSSPNRTMPSVSTERKLPFKVGSSNINAKDGKQVKVKKGMSTIYKNPMLNASKIKKIPANDFNPESIVGKPEPEAEIEHIEQPPVLIPDVRGNEWLEPPDIDVGERESAHAIIKKHSSRKLLLPEPDFSRMPAEDIIRHLQKEQRLSFVPSKQNLSRRSSHEFTADHEKENFISSPRVVNPFHPKSKAKILPRKIEVPWGRNSAFTSPAAQRKQIFQNFHKTSPDPPRTPSPPPKLSASKSLVNEGQSLYTQRPSRSAAIEAKYLSSPTENAKSLFLRKEKEFRIKEREMRRHIAASQTTVVSEGRELAALSKSANGLVSINKGKKLNSPRKATGFEERIPPNMEGNRLGSQKKSSGRSRQTKREHKSGSAGAEASIGNMFIGTYVAAPESNHQFQR